MIDPEDLKCPITTLYFRNPCIASDGHIYEKEIIDRWLRCKQTSPLTREPMESTTYPCHIIKKIIDSMELNSTDPMFYTKRYQCDLKEWFNLLIKKHKIKLTDIQNKIINDIKVPEIRMHHSLWYLTVHSGCCSIQTDVCRVYGETNCSYGNICKFIDLNKYLDHTNINVCRMSDRIVLYDQISQTHQNNCPLDENKCKQIIESTHPDDDGLKYFLNRMTYHSIYHLLTPSIHFQLFEQNTLMHYVESMENIDQWINFIEYNFKYIDTNVKKIILHCFVSNKGILLGCNDTGNHINQLFNSWSNDCKLLCHSERYSVLGHLFPPWITCKSEKMIEPMYKAFNKLVELKLFHGFDEVFDICWFIDSLYPNTECMIKFEETLQHLLNCIGANIGENEIDAFIPNFFQRISQCKNIDIKMFIQWMIEKNISLNKKYQTHSQKESDDDIFSFLFSQRLENNKKGERMTIHSCYLRNIGNLSGCDINNLKQFIESGIMIDSEDLKIYADLPEKIEEENILEKLCSCNDN